MLASGTSSRSSQFTACSSTDFKGNNFKALVYEFMTNGSLDNWLNPNPYDQGNERNLTLFQRFFITTEDINQAQTSSTGVRGTVGYVTPEHGMGGKISAEGDVYSYGILLLEMFLGKSPTSSSMLIIFMIM